MKKALIFRGGWAGHEPVEVSEKIAEILLKNNIRPDIYDGTECLTQLDLLQYDLIVPCITASKLSSGECTAVSNAVAKGVGLAGCHGGMCDAFRESTEWQFMTGGQWVAHPGGTNVNYTVNIIKGSSPITEGLCDFEVCSEQYYLHVDPAIEILATTRFPVAIGRHYSNKAVDMPVAWTKFWGLGRVFYCSLFHKADEFDKIPNGVTLLEKGMVWASDSKYYATTNNLDAEIFNKN